MKIGFGVITRDFDSEEPYLDFLLNAKKYGWHIDSLIVNYENKCDEKVVKKLSKYTKVLCSNIGKHSIIYKKLKKINISLEQADDILMGLTFYKYKHLPYGAHRNYVLLDAYMQKLDYLLFFDTDVYPKILTSEKKFKEVDWVKSHMQYLSKPKIIATSSDYTGYYIIPLMKRFKGILRLFKVLQKNYRWYSKMLKINGLVTQDSINVAETTTKLLGGNMGLSMKNIHKLPPFYSTYYILKNKFILSRGEDTLLGPAIYKEKGFRAVDMGTKIFHNTFKDYPEIPYIYKKAEIDRFYNATLGWIGKNPFFNWFVNKRDFSKDSAYTIYKKQKKIINDAAKYSAEHFEDERFLLLPEALEESYSMLDTHIKNFNKLMKSWNKIVAALLKNY